MLRTNLATRPFYNDRAIRFGLAVGVIMVAALTVFNVLQVVSLNRRNAELSGQAQLAETNTAQLRDKARATTQSLNNKEVDAIQMSAREANQLIARRAFSWTDLFNRFEETLPADVRITAVQPQLDEEGRLLVAVTVMARRAEDLNAFIDQLEATGAFSDLI
ncbi:MAG: hypothetical protein H0T71_02835, partial [Acidobacteria bacterium]|nr:hypothetical protein [Acidobacteriota bacterium]